MADPDPDPDDADWLLARERGDDVSHVSPQSRARYEQLDQLIAALPDRPPPAGWKQRVLDALDAPAPRSSSDALDAPAPHSSSDALALSPAIPAAAALSPPPPRSPADALAPPPSSPSASAVRAAAGRRTPIASLGSAGARSTPGGSAESIASLGSAGPRSTPGGSAESIARGWRAWILAAGGAVVGIVVLSLLVRPRPQSPRAAPVVTTEIRRSDRPHRGGDVSVGDTLVVRAQSEQPIELRIYGEGGELLARCTETQGCAVERSGAHRRYMLDVPLRAPGHVRTVLFTGEPIPSPGPSLDADLDAAHAAHVDARQVATVLVE